MSGLADRIATLSPEQRERLRARLGVSGPPTIEALHRDERDFELSYAQERLWFLDQLAPGNPFYNIALAQVLPFLPDVSRLNEALALMVARHESFRTQFVQDRQQVVQRVLPHASLACEVQDLRRERDPLGRAAHIASALSQQPFDLSRGPLARCRLLLLGPSQSALLLVIHHIVADGWSLEKLLGEIGRTYGELVAGRRGTLPPLRVQYADFSVWQRRTLSGQRLERHRSYWLQKLTALPQLSLPTDRPRPSKPSYRGARVSVAIEPSALHAVDALARRVKTTRFVVLLTAFGALLHRLAAQEEVAVGTPMAARPHPELEDVVGFFTNTVVLRLDFRGACSFEEAVTRVHACVREAQDHQDLPFSMVVAALAPDMDLSRNPLFQVSFQILTSSQVAAPHHAAPALSFERGTSAFDLTLQLCESNTGLDGNLEYSTDLFEQATARAFAQRFERLVGAVSHDPGIAIGRVPLLDAAERDQLEAWSRGPSTSRPAVGVLELIQAQARRTPNALACQGPDRSLSYSELMASASRVAARLRACDVGRGQCVGVCVPPSPDLLAALLGVWIAGAAYVPLDPAYPVERMRAMLADAQVRVVLADGTVAPELPDHLKVVAVSGDACETPAAEPAWLQPSDTAYVLFTSGSTGRPKGVVVRHGALCNYLLWCLDAYPVQSGDGAPLCTSIGADMSVTTLYVPLLSGKAVFFLGPDDDPLGALEQALRGTRRYSFIKLTPSHLEGLRHLLGDGLPACATACFIVGGEALLAETLAPWRHCTGLLVANEYGPTETTVGCCAHIVPVSELRPGPVPIGRPIANTFVLVSDAAGEPVPAGVTGELRIAGAGVASGYVGNRHNSDCFVTHPDGTRFYRSGDLVRYRRDGELEYLGRVDEQIKVRGHRVEPVEVERALRTHPAVADAVVVLQRVAGAAERLSAALQLQPDMELDASKLAPAIRDHLRHQVPAYMIPSEFGRIDRIPITTSGKVDRARVAEELQQRAAPSRTWTAPESALERLIVQCFADVLKVSKPGVSDDFFADLGGHSLLATRLISQLRELLQTDIPLRLVFEAPSARALAHALASAAPADQIEAAAAIVLDVLAMSETEVRQRLRGGEGESPCG